MDNNFQVIPLTLIFGRIVFFCLFLNTIFADQNMIGYKFQNKNINLHTKIQKTKTYVNFTILDSPYCTLCVVKRMRQLLQRLKC